MNVSITPELENFVNAKVESGMYGSASEVVREGLRLLEEQDQIRRIRIKKLNEEIQIGLDSAAREGWVTPEESIARMKARKEKFFSELKKKDEL